MLWYSLLKTPMAKNSVSEEPVKNYKALGILKRQFPSASLIGLTATATSHVLKDAQKILCVEKCFTFTASFNRPNLYYEVRQKPSNTEDFIEDIVKLINGRYKGQSGRDDMKADCILYYGFGDIFRISSMVVMENVGQQKLYEMVSYCQNISNCRRVLIAQHFDEVWSPETCNKMCDNCCKEISFERKNVTAYCRDLIKILKQAEELKEKLTPLKLIDSWMGRGAAKLRVAGVAPPALPREDLEKIIAHFLIRQEDYSFTAYATISYLKIGPKANLLNNEEHVITMQAESPQSCHSEGADKKREEKTPGNFQKKSVNMLQQPDCKITGAKKRKIDNA
ncbi:hypothetical protein J1605_006588 [Eschrichtius robustus]|uniref:DNA 3'-5' helicase n=1 Tax=Eschrichtius robustus TaxID=9764 RepID=A0AB34H2M6_ESCRO|nr:hypothetical protein J1605_006588 [Eschrichtius robustus]